MSSKRGQVLIDRDDLIGQKVGKLEVIYYHKHWYERTAGGERMRHSYICLCECGKCKEVRRDQLKNKIIKSCGCSRRKDK